MPLEIRRRLWTCGVTALLAMSPACDSGDNAPIEDPCGEPLYGGEATDEAWRTFVDAQGRPDDSSHAVTLTEPSPGQMYSLTDAPPTWRWSSPLASRAPAGEHGERSMLAWLGHLLLPSAQAHLPPVTGDFYWVQVTVPGRRCPVELLTSDLEWHLDTATWDTLRAASGPELRVQVTSAYLVQNRLREGPYRMDSPRTIRLEGAR
ncbi:hypothetical protein [Myxococcus hansupus]|uniref:hypothetical protein n=1 Tax=Pseudomyxococcus hansupus TaxID=1297742 RepID=UPI0006765233